MQTLLERQSLLNNSEDHELRMKECVKTASPQTGQTQSGDSSPRAAGWCGLEFILEQPSPCAVTRRHHLCGFDGILNHPAPWMILGSLVYFFKLPTVVGKKGDINTDPSPQTLPPRASKKSRRAPPPASAFRDTKAACYTTFF